MVKNLPANAGEVGSVTGLGISLAKKKKNGNPLQYSCLGNPRDRGAWWAVVHRVRKELDMTNNKDKQYCPVKGPVCALSVLASQLP